MWKDKCVLLDSASSDMEIKAEATLKAKATVFSFWTGAFCYLSKSHLTKQHCVCSRMTSLSRSSLQPLSLLPWQYNGISTEIHIRWKVRQGPEKIKWRMNVRGGECREEHSTYGIMEVFNFLKTFYLGQADTWVEGNCITRPITNLDFPWSYLNGLFCQNKKRALVQDYLHTALELMVWKMGTGAALPLLL